MTRTPFAMILATAIVAVSFLFLGGCGGSGDSGGNSDGGNQTVQNPPKRKVRVEFRQPHTGERLRRHIYAEDGVTEVELQIEYADGAELIQYFRMDGSLKEEKTIYPGGKVIGRHGVYAADGKTLVSEIKNRMDGTIEKSLKRAADGTVETEDFFRDGSLSKYEKKAPDGSGELRIYHEDGSPSKTEKTFADGSFQLQLYYRSGKLQIETRSFADGTKETLKYREDGTVKETISKLAGGNEETRAYHDDGKRLISLEVNLPGRDSEITYYHDDGSTPSVKFYKQWSSKKRAEVYDKNGSLAHTREYKSGGELVITVVNYKGVATYRQTWQSSGYGHYSYTNYRLEKVEELAADGKTVVRKLEMDYYNRFVEESHLYDANGKKIATRYYRDDKTLEKEELMDAGGTITSAKHYRDDGTLEKEEKMAADGTVIETIPHEGTEAFSLDVEDGELKQPEFKDPSTSSGYPYDY